jgi:hypothetical protein
MCKRGRRAQNVRMESLGFKLSSSEKRTLQLIARGEFHMVGFDWVALQHLILLGLTPGRLQGAPA